MASVKADDWVREVTGEWPWDLPVIPLDEMYAPGASWVADILMRGARAVLVGRYSDDGSRYAVAIDDGQCPREEEDE